jgi:hypothetical protein
MNTLQLGIVLNQNTDFSLVILIKDQDGPIDITGYQFKGQMRASTDPSSPVVAEFVFTIQDQTMEATLGQVLWSLPAADSAEGDITTSFATPLVFPRQKTPFIFDVKMMDTTSKITRIVEGVVYVSPEATQESFS